MQPQNQNQTFSQGKLTKSEWNNMEIPVTPDELTIIKLIKDSYHDVQKKYNKNISMIGVPGISILFQSDFVNFP